MKVDVTNDLTRFDRSAPELEWLWLFSIMVANKPAELTAGKLDELLAVRPGTEPFDVVRYLRRIGRLTHTLERVRAGQYGRIISAFIHTTDNFRDMTKVTLDDLESCPGVGPKTSRFFLMHTRPDQRFAALDTHILKFLRDCGHDAPKGTPPAGPKYRSLEEAYLAECDKRGRDPAEFDFEIWKTYREGGRIDAT